MFALIAGGFLVLFGALVLMSGGEADTTLHDDPRANSTVGTNVPVITDAPVASDPVDPGSVYDPVRAGEETPKTYRQLLGRDQIAPVYDPGFTTADDIEWDSEILVVGVEGASTSKAYPVSYLNRREMVIDHIDGDPILVTW